MRKSNIAQISIILILLLVPHMSSIPSEEPEVRNIFTTSSMVNATDLAEEVYNAVSEPSYLYFVKKLTENGSRVSDDANTQLARSWITSELGNVSGGLIDVTYHGFVGANPAYNIIGKLPGTLGDSGPSVMIGAHYDSVSGAPGANDDGSGVASTLELARILSQYDWPLDIYFCFWNYEEQSWQGSRSSTQIFVEEEMDLLIYFNIDMLFVQDTGAPPDERVQMTYRLPTGAIFHDAQYWAELTRVMNNNFDKPIIKLVIGSELEFTDLRSFEQAGYKAAVGVEETGFADDTAYHSPDDVWDNPAYNYSIATMTTASIGASIAYALSRTQGEMTRSRYDVDLASGESRDLLLEVSMLSDLQIEGTWASSGGLDFTLRDSSNVVVATNTTALSSADSAAIFNVTPTEFGLHKLTIENTGGSPIALEIVIIQDTDIEGNGIPDSQETWFNDFTVDSDGDLLFDGEEEINSLDRYNNDTDENDILDGIDDWDNDGLTNVEEIRNYGTDFNHDDTDLDLMPDGYEVDVGHNPLVIDRNEDPDNDTASNYEEYIAGTNPWLNDTDQDNMPDGWEIDNDLNPLLDDASLNPDGDGLSNIDEYLTGHDPQVADWSAPIDFILIGGILGVAAVAIVAVFMIWKRRQPG